MLRRKRLTSCIWTLHCPDWCCNPCRKYRPMQLMLLCTRMPSDEISAWKKRVIWYSPICHTDVPSKPVVCCDTTHPIGLDCLSSTAFKQRGPTRTAVPTWVTLRSIHGQETFGTAVSDLNHRLLSIPRRRSENASA